MIRLMTLVFGTSMSLLYFQATAQVTIFGNGRIDAKFGTDNVAVEVNALSSNTTGAGNTATGTFSFYNNATGSKRFVISFFNT